MSRLDDIRARCDAATAGLWEWRWVDCTDDDDSGDICFAKDPSGRDDDDSTDTPLFTPAGEGCRGEDAKFIAHARADVPWLLEALRLANEVLETGWTVQVNVLDSLHREKWIRAMNAYEAYSKGADHD